MVLSGSSSCQSGPTKTTVRSSMAIFPTTTPGTTEGDGSNEIVWIIPTVVGAIILIALGILTCLFLRRKRKRQLMKRELRVNYAKSSLNLGTSISTTSIGEINSSSDIGVSTNTDIQGDDVELDITDALPGMSSGDIFPEPSRKTLSLPNKIFHHNAPTASKEGVPSNVDSLVTEVKRPDQSGPKFEHVQRKYTYVSEADREKSSSLPILKDTKSRDLSLKGAKRIFAYRYYGAGGSKEYSRHTSIDSGYQTNTSSERSSWEISELDENEFSEQCESPISNKEELIFPEKKYKPKKHRSQTVSKSERRIKKNITPEGGVMKLDEAVLRIGAGCLAEDTEITMINDSENSDFKSLVDLDLISAMPSVFEFLPDGLKFLKPADLTIRLKRIAPDLELFLLRGSYNHNDQKMIWELVAGRIDENRTNGVINVKIDGFSVYTFFSAMRGLISRILSHLNYSFTCVAYAFFRRLPPMDKIDIAVVLVSEFVDKYEEKDIKQLKDHLKEGYVRSDKGMAKRLQTDRSLQMHLHFSGIELSPFVFEIDQPQLDSIGYVIDHFKGVSIESPASGNITIGEEDYDINSEFLWKLKIHENEDDTNENGKSQKRDDEPEVVYRMTKLTRVEITRMSRMVAMDWDSLAGLLDIPYEEREEIRTNYMKYPDSPSRAEEVLKHFNDSDCFGRDVFGKCVDELGRHDLIKKLHPVEEEGDVTRADVCQRVETELLQTKMSERNGNEEIQIKIPPEEDVQPLSPREMFRLSRRIAVDWDSLAGLMDIAKEERDDIRCNVAIYSDNRSRAEKILSIFNRKRDFSRKKLVECLKEIKKLDVIRPIITGEWKFL